MTHSSMKKFILLFTVTLVMMSCGEQCKAKGVVKDFLKENLTSADYSTQRFSDVDSTRNVTPEQVAALRKMAGEWKVFKKEISYHAYEQRDALKFTRMMLRDNDDTLQCTFYLDTELKQVVAVKAY